MLVAALQVTCLEAKSLGTSKLPSKARLCSVVTHRRRTPKLSGSAKWQRNN